MLVETNEDRFILSCNATLSLLFYIIFWEGDCQGRRPSLSHLSQKFKHFTWHGTALLAAWRHATQEKWPYQSHLSAVSLHAWEKQNSALRFPLYCTSICIQSGTLSLSPLAIHPANEVFMSEGFAFWYIIPIHFQFHSIQARLVSERKKWTR